MRNDYAYLSECFEYEAGTGLLMWRRRPRAHFLTAQGWACFNTREAGTSAGRMQPTGYSALRMDRKLYYAHRIAWILGNKQSIPQGFIIDHIDGDKTNNRLSNLRLATKAQNGQNSRQRKSRSGEKGIFFDKNRGTYFVYVTANGRRQSRRCRSLDEARSVAREMREAAHGGFSNHGGCDAP